MPPFGSNSRRSTRCTSNPRATARQCILDFATNKGACRRDSFRYITLLGQSVGSGVFETHFASQPHFPPRFFLVFHLLFSFGISLCLGNRSVRSGLKHILPPSHDFLPPTPPLQCLTKLYCSRICIPKGRTSKSPKNFNLTLLTAVGARLDWMKIRWKRLRNHYGFQSIVRIVFRCRQYFSYWISSDLKRRTRSKCACRSAMRNDAKACDTDLLFWTAERK